jgi:thymidine kinase
VRRSIMPDVVGIDEAQFFDPQIIEYVKSFITLNIRVVLAGLDTDYSGEPFGSIPHLMAIGDKVLKLSAVCTQCGQSAVHTHRLTRSKDLVQVGASGMYDARCRDCWNASPDSTK